MRAEALNLMLQAQENGVFDSAEELQTREPKLLVIVQSQKQTMELRE